jgi:NAD(P)-dependent dehydrogenase (short-subunit alcohol dehydrogenase family)
MEFFNSLLDLTDPASIQKAIEDLSRVEIDVLINNAGVMTYGSLVDMPWDDITRSLEVHVEGPLRLIRALVPKMVTRDYGRIVNVSSGSGAFAEGLGQLGAYNFTKAALNALTVSVALTVPSSVKVNAMCPGWCRTRMGGWNAARSADEGADTVIWLATVPRTGPTGGFFRDRAPIPW